MATKSDGQTVPIVPSQASYDDFWARYFFRVQEVEYEEEHRKKIMGKALPIIVISVYACYKI